MSVLDMWTVYERPSDYPDSYVARRFEVHRDGVRATGSIVISDDLENLRNLLEEMGLSGPLTRSEEDESRIVETWL